MSNHSKEKKHKKNFLQSKIENYFADKYLLF